MNPRQTLHRLASLTPIAATLSLLVPAHADTETWSGATNGTWDTSTANWLTDGSNNLFESGDDALFTGTPTNSVTAATGLTIGTITLGGTFTGSVTMSGANTVSGATTISGGTLNLNHQTGLGSSAVTLNSGGTVNVTLGSDQNVNNVFTGAGILTVSGSTGTPNFNNASALNGFTGTFNINTSGGKKVALTTAGEKIGSGATVNITSGGTLYIANTTASFDGVTFNVVGSGNTENLGAIRIENNSVIGATSSVVLGGDTSFGSNAGTGTINAAITQSTASGLTKVGAQTLALGGSNTYTGTTTISAGTLQLGTGGTTGSLSTSSAITNNATLAINRSNAVAQGTDFNSVISGTGTFIQRGTGTTTLSGANTYTGGTRANAGTLVLSGSHTKAAGTTDFLSVNNTGAGNAVAKVTAGTHGFTDINLAETANTRGAIYQSGGDLATGTTGGIGVRVGSGATSYGYYNLSGGTLTLSSAQDFGVGFGSGATGVMDVTAGSVSTASWIVLGRNGAGNGLLNVKGGSVTSNSNNIALNWANTAGSLSILNVGGGAGAATVTGVSDATKYFDVTQSNTAGTTGVANLLSNGTLTVAKVQGSNGGSTGLFNFNGGTLKATAANAGANFMTSGNVDAVTVYGSGGTIDNNGTSITIGNALGAATDNGVTSVAVTDGGSGYIGAPLVKFTDGTGNPATGYAVMADDGTGNGTFRVSSIVITSPGTYTVNPTTVTLTGGGASAAATLGSITTAANTSGGMKFQGSGTTTLSAVNTYTGSTAVTGGTLALGGSADINASSGVTVNGTGAKFVQNSSITPTIPVTLTNGTVDGTTILSNVTVGNSASNVVTNGNGGTGALTIDTLTFNDAATINLNVASTFPEITTTTLTTGAVNGAGKITVNASAASWAPGEYQLISYTTLGGVGFSEFQKGTITGLSGRQSATLGNSGGNITLTIAGDNPVWTGALNGNWTTAALGAPKNWKLITSSAPTDYINGDIVLFDDTATGTTAVTISSANVSPLSTTFNNSGVDNSGLDYTVSGAFGIATGSVTLDGSGAVTLSTPNTYPGGTNLNAGTLRIGNASAVGTGPLVIAAGTTLDVAASPITLSTNNAQTWNGGFAFAGTADLNMGTGAVTLAANSTITTANTSTLTVGGSINGAFSLNKAGSGTLSLSGTSSSIGNLMVSGGLLKITGGTFNVAENSGNNTQLNSGGSVEVSGGTLNISGAGGWFPIGDTNGQTSTFTVSGGTVNIANNFGTEVGRLGGGVLTINSGSFSATDTNGVGFIVGDNQAGSAGVGTVNLNGGTFTVNKITSITANPNKFYFNGGVLKPSASNAAWFAATANLSTEVRNGGAVIDTNSFNVTLAEDIVHSTVGGDNASDGGLTKAGAGILTLSGANAYTGTTTVNGGVLAVDGDAIPNAGKLVINGGKVDPTGVEVVNTLFFGAVQKAAGTWGSTASTATNKDDVHFSGTGVVSVTNGLGGGYSAWADANAPGQTMDQDHDNDGVKNGIEYFMGLSGSAFTANPGPVSGTVTWPMGATYAGVYGTDYQVQTSTDLATWTQVPTGTGDNTVTVNPGASVVYDMPTGGKRFVRLVVTN